METNLLSRCGIYCGACYVYRAERDCGDFLRHVAEWQNVELDEVKCNGCFAPDEEKWPNCQKCWPAKCLKEKKLDYCYQCDSFWDYSCDHYKGMEDFCAKRGENIRQNMVKMMSDKQKFLADQDKHWRCPSCGEPYSWYEKTCHHCGKSLKRKDLTE
jgi:predicted RNA-binding Zn-ribbon protein involved in translation (DUF1610 family)